MNKCGQSPFDKPVEILRSRDPAAVAEKAGAAWTQQKTGTGFIEVPVLNGTIRVSYPGAQIDAGREIDRFTLKLLTVMYLANTDGTPPSHKWIAYRDVPDGRFYEPVVKRSVEDPLAQTFGDDLECFSKAAIIIGGEKGEFEDISFSFSLFPKVRYLVILWKGDKEFSPRANILIDSNCHHHLGAFEMRMGAEELYKLLEKHSS